MPEETGSTSPSSASNAAGSTYLVGTAWRNITPCTKEMSLAGRCAADSVFCDSPSNARPSLRASGYNPTGSSFLDHDEIPLSVQAFAIKDSAAGVIVLVSIDVLNFDRAFSDSIRSAVSTRAGLQPNQLLLCATHTHRAPTMLAAHAAGGMAGEVPPNPSYVAEVARLAADCVVEAVTRATTPARLHLGRGSSNAVVYRRTDGVRDPNVPFPQRLDVLEARSPTDGRTLAVAVFLGCHATTTIRDDATTASADYPGVMRQLVEAALNVPKAVLFFQGFGGDLQSIEYALEGEEGHSDPRRATGCAIASEVMRLLPRPAAGTGKTVDSVDLTGIIRGPIAVDTRVQQLPLAGGGTLEAEFQVIKFGTDPAAADAWVIVALSHEVVSEYAPVIRSRWPRPDRVTLVGYANRIESYLPTRRMIELDRASGAHGQAYEGYYSFVTTYHLSPPDWADALVAINASILVDDFYDGARDDRKWVTGALDLGSVDPMVRVEERGGVLNLSPLEAAGGLHYNGYVSLQSFSLIDRRASLKVVRTPSAASNAELLFSVGLDSANSYRFDIQAGRLRADEIVAGSRSYTDVGAFDPAMHSYLQLRHANGLLRWETSPDGGTWSSLHEAAPAFSLEAVRVEVIAGTYKPETSPGTAAVDDFLLDAAFDHVWKRSLRDAFATEDMDPSLWESGALPQWDGSLHDPDVNVTQGGGRLTVDLRSGVTGFSYGGYLSARAYDLRGRSASVELVEVPTSDSAAEAIFAVAADGDNLYRFDVLGGVLRAEQRVAGVSSNRTVGPFSAAEHRHLRIRHEPTSDQVVWETSPDGKGWSIHCASPVAAPLSQVRFELIAGTWRPEVAPGRTVYGGFLHDGIAIEA